MRLVYCSLLLLFCSTSFAQPVTEKIKDAFQKFESDSQLQSAISSLYVIDAKTGNVIFEKNAKVGLATASTLKIVTAASAYEMLGRDFRYETKFGYVGKMKGKNLLGDWYIKPSGDPTLGSWRYQQTKDSVVLNDFADAAKKSNIAGFNGVVIDQNGWNDETIPDGWIWQDIGNYYGAGPTGFNWYENQFDVILRSGKNIGDPVAIVNTKPQTKTIVLQSLATSAAKGSGDNSYVYYPLYSTTAIVRGTIPINESSFTISAANPNAKQEFVSLLMNQLVKNKMGQIHYEDAAHDTTYLTSHYSPSLDSIVYWFLKKSINLYGEALVKTIAYQKTGLGATDKGVDIVRKYWKEKGVDPLELNIVDGSGLSPLDRVTTHAQVQVLQYAKNQQWFTGYFDAFPVYNEMKMKSGTIHGVKGFCGYHTSKEGKEYIFSFLVNNYNGPASSLVQKMYKVLDQLK